MKMVKAVIAIVVVAAIGIGAFMFLNSPEQKIKGTWESESLTLAFDKEGNVEVTYLDTSKFSFELPISGKGSFNGTYEISKDGDNDIVTIHTSIKVILDVSYDLVYAIDFEDGNMILKAVHSDGSLGDAIIFTKAK